MTLMEKLKMLIDDVSFCYKKMKFITFLLLIAASAQYTWRFHLDDLKQQKDCISQNCSKVILENSDEILW